MVRTEELETSVIITFNLIHERSEKPAEQKNEKSVR